LQIHIIDRGFKYQHIPIYIGNTIQVLT